MSKQISVIIIITLFATSFCEIWADKTTEYQKKVQTTNVKEYNEQEFIAAFCLTKLGEI